MIGHSISHYKIIDKLGEGGMGVVYKAMDTRLDRIVAIKFLSTFRLHEEQVKKRFLQEAKAIAALNHPNIATVYEIDHVEEEYFIVMEYCGGKTLQERIRDESLSVRDATFIALNIAKGLHNAHQKGIIHRDIKPANIIFTEEGDPKIIDFGLAKLANQTMLTNSGTTMGTVSYMSPEQLMGAPADQRSDIWALGVILYEMLAGECPFSGQFPQAIMYSVTNEEPEYISKVQNGVPAQIEKIINKALQKNPEKRYEKVEVLLEDLQQAYDDMGKSNGHSTWIYKLGRKQKKAVTISSAVILSLILVLTLFWGKPDIKATGPVSIALLPLDDLSDGGSQEWFSDGMTDALITDLARISGVRIISRASVVRYKGANSRPSEIGAELDVDYVIEGTVLGSDDQIRITIRLIDTRNDEYIWAEVYNRDLKNVLTLQGEVAGAIAGQIEVQLTPSEEEWLTNRDDVDPMAYEYYLKGNYNRWQLSEESLERAQDYYKMAIELDPGYAPAYSGLAFVYLSRAQSGYVTLKDVIEPAEQAAQKALAIDSTMAEMYHMLGTFDTYVYWDWEAADANFSRAIELNPNLPEARMVYSHLLFYLKRGEEGLFHIKEALRQDPFNPLFKAIYSMDLMYMKQYDKVIEQMEKNLEASPGDRVSLSTLRSAYHQKGMYDKAIETWRRSFEGNEDQEAIEILMNAYEKEGYSAALREVAELYIQRSKSEYVTPWQIGTLYARAGMKKESLDYLEKAFEERDLNMPYLSVDPIFDYMRDDPRFIDLIRKMDLM